MSKEEKKKIETEYILNVNNEEADKIIWLFKVRNFGFKRICGNANLVLKNLV